MRDCSDRRVWDKPLLWSSLQEHTLRINSNKAAARGRKAFATARAAPKASTAPRGSNRRPREKTGRKAATRVVLLGSNGNSQKSSSYYVFLVPEEQRAQFGEGATDLHGRSPLRRARQLSAQQSEGIPEQPITNFPRNIKN